MLLRILTTCELIGLTPEAYLAGVLPQLARGIRIAEDLSALMPAAWLAGNPDDAIPALNVQRVSRFND
ncbi:MAG: transposase domain-containing protein [Deltaproteobacteria bacterium]|nr:transposase domain-containing protein [Deltaproteobacteria bacterium]